MMKALLIIADLDVPYTALAKIATSIQSFFQVILRGSSFSLAIFHPHPHPPFLVLALYVVVQKVDNAIHRINLYPLYPRHNFPNIDPLDDDLSDGQLYPTFKQPEPEQLVDNKVQCSTPEFSRKFMEVQSNFFHTDTKGTEPIVHFTEVSVLQRQGMYDFGHFWDQTNCLYYRGVCKERLGCTPTPTPPSRSSHPSLPIQHNIIKKLSWELKTKLHKCLFKGQYINYAAFQTASISLGQTEANKEKWPAEENW